MTPDNKAALKAVYNGLYLLAGQTADINVAAQLYGACHTLRGVLLEMGEKQITARSAGCGEEWPRTLRQRWGALK